MIYMMQAGVRGPIKIGHVKGGLSEVAARRATLQTGCPQVLTVLAVAPGDSSVEALLHEHFGAYRIGGEWFLLPEDEFASEVGWDDLTLITYVIDAMLGTVGLQLREAPEVQPVGEER